MKAGGGIMGQEQIPYEPWTRENTAEFDLAFLEQMRDGLRISIEQGITPEHHAVWRQEIADLDAIIAFRRQALAS
jgi:hypothetical protein